MIAPMILRTAAPLFTSLILAGCTGQPSHIPNPLLLPGQAVITGLENSAYNSRRAKVARYVAAHHGAILSDASKGFGPNLTQAMRIARVPASRDREVARVLAADAALYASDVEATVVALMVHSR